MTEEEKLLYMEQKRLAEEEMKKKKEDMLTQFLKVRCGLVISWITVSILKHDLQTKFKDKAVQFFAVSTVKYTFSAFLILSYIIALVLKGLRLDKNNKFITPD